MTKVLQVTFSDGSIWQIDAKPIAEQRAAYYAKHDTGVESGDAYQEIFKAEFEYAMKDGYEIVDWAANNLDWFDVEQQAVMVHSPTQIKYADAWPNAEMKVVDV